jgi:hypothetical protein
MKKLLIAFNGEHYFAAILRTAFVLLIGAALVFTFSMAIVPVAKATDKTPAQMIQSQLPEGKTPANASKTEFLSAACAAAKKFRAATPAIVKAAVNAHPNWSREILRTAITCLGADNCSLIASSVNAAVKAMPDDANGLIELGIQLAPNCTEAIGQIPAGGGGEGAGVFTNPPTNQNPPPGSLGGGGGGFNPEEQRVSVCDNNVEVLVLASRVSQYLATHPGATTGACQPTSVTNR